MLHREPLEGLTIRAALLLGFGLTFGIWLFAGYSFTKRIGRNQGLIRDTELETAVAV